MPLRYLYLAAALTSAVALAACGDNAASPDSTLEGGADLGADTRSDAAHDTASDTAIDSPGDAPPRDQRIDGPDASPPDTAADAPLRDTASEATADATRDATPDATRDVGMDGRVDGNGDAAVDAPLSDTTADSPLPDTTVDAPLCAAALNPLSDGTSLPVGGIPDLVMSEVRPGASGFVELFNTTNAAIAISSVTHQLCSPFVYIALSNATIGAGVVVPAGGYATVNFPSTFSDTAAGGEVILYRTGSFIPGNILDFVCWGSNPHSSRLAEAQSVNKWSGGCAAALTAGSIHRRIGTTGTTAAAYDTTSAASPQNCTP